MSRYFTVILILRKSAYIVTLIAVKLYTAIRRSIIIHFIVGLKKLIPLFWSFNNCWRGKELRRMFPCHAGGQWLQICILFIMLAIYRWKKRCLLWLIRNAVIFQCYFVAYEAITHLVTINAKLTRWNGVEISNKLSLLIVICTKDFNLIWCFSSFNSIIWHLFFFCYCRYGSNANASDIIHTPS